MKKKKAVGATATVFRR